MNYFLLISTPIVLVLTIRFYCQKNWFWAIFGTILIIFNLIIFNLFNLFNQ